MKKFSACINHPDRKSEARGMCKSCYNGWHLKQNPDRMAAKRRSNKEWQTNNKEYLQSYLKKNANKIKHRQAIYQAKKNYGLSKDQFLTIKKKSQGKCAICHIENVRLNIDHCHKTGAVGSLLCSPCNWLVSFVENRPEVITSAKAYVKKFRPLSAQRKTLP